MAPRRLLFIERGRKNQKSMNEKRCGRKSMTIIAISLPALGWKWPVETIFVLRQTRDNDGRGRRAAPRRAPSFFLRRRVRGGIDFAAGCLNPLPP